MAGITDVDNDKDDSGSAQQNAIDKEIEKCNNAIQTNDHGSDMEDGCCSDLSSSSDSRASDHCPFMHANVVVPTELTNGSTGHLNGDINDESSSDSQESAKDVSSQIEKKTTTVSESSNEKSNADQTDDKSKEQEIVFIQDTGFTVKIIVPGVVGNEPFDLPVSSMELVQEIHQVLMDREDTCHRTCFSIQLDGITLDNFAELKSIEGLADGSLLKVVEEPYTAREARIHVRHVRDLLKSVDPADSYNGVDCNSPSFLNTVTAGDILEKKRGKVDSLDCTPPDYLMPCSRELLIIPLHPAIKEQRGPQCLKVLTFSGWNPPPGNRRMHGDLLYLYILTLEDKRFHLTASTRGFFVNMSTEDEFEPRASQQKHLSHSLIELLNQISPAFKKNFALLLKKRAQKHPFERVPTPYQVYSWLAPALEHNIDYIRAEDAFSTRLGYEEHIPGQTRDWNEEIQTTRELPKKNLPERLIRERAIFKVHSDFVAAATRGAMAVIDGNVMAINPGEETKVQMFIWNNIFFSLGFDVRDHYKDFGGDAAAYAAPDNDLQGVKAYFSCDPDNLYVLGTVVVDYRGYRVTAQSIIPGILEREQEQSVVYGSVDFGKTVVSNDKYKDLLQKTSTQLKIRIHKVLNEKDEEVELYSSVECKGIVGNDQRYYVLDLLRTFPPDVNFLKVDDDKLSETMQKEGFPYAHRHKIVCLRQELIEAFVETRYMAFVKHAALQFQRLQLKRQGTLKHLAVQDKVKIIPEPVKDTTTDVPLVNGHIDEKDNVECVNGHGLEDDAKTKDGSVEKEGSQSEMETDEAKKIVEALTASDSETFEENSKDIVRRAAEFVGSLSDTEFAITFNPDVYQPYVKHASPESETLTKEKQLVKDAAEFLVLHQIPALITECLDHTSSPIDGITLTELMHNRGINMRYLGKVTEAVAKRPSISYMHGICLNELVCRSAKHIFKLYLQMVDQMSFSASLSHFLNCFLGSFASPHPQMAADDVRHTRRKSKRRNKGSHSSGSDHTEWVQETPKTLWKKICDEVSDYYHYTLDVDGVDTFVERFDVQKISMLRSFCLKAGLQILLREYFMDVKHKESFSEEDIINMYPIVKNIHPKASDAYHFFTSGQAKIQQGLLQEGYELISEALNLLNNVYGAMHPEIAACLRLLARLNYIMGDYLEALSYQQRAVFMSERVLGVDHPNTITEYAHLALYCFANNQVSSALRLMYRARYLALLCYGENHPEVALFDSNIGLILHAVEEYDLSLRFLEKALQVNIQFNGSKSLKVAMNYHLVARTHSCRGDFRAALNSEKEAYAIYKQQLGEEHDRTKESSECLKHLTQQAVEFQKKMNELYKGDKVVTFPPLQIQTPSLASVLDTLNVINGIVFVQISQDDIERFRKEMARRQSAQAEPAIKEKKDFNANTVISKNTSTNLTDTAILPSVKLAETCNTSCPNGIDNQSQILSSGTHLQEVTVSEGR